MFNVLADVNWLSVVLAVVAMSVVAGVYFAVLVAEPYTVALGRQGAPAPETSLLTDLGPVVCLAATTITTAVLVEALDITSIADGVIFGLIVGVGFLTPMAFQIAINPNFPRPLYYGILNAPFFIAAGLISSIIIVAMR